MIMKKWLTLSFLMVFALASYAQQEEVYTTFMYNKVHFNPAYAGAPGRAELTFVGKGQWLGLEGAPNSQVITFNMPLANQRIGIGGGVVRNEIGPSVNYTGELSYAYRIPLGRGYLGIGVQGSIRFLRVDFSQVQGNQPIDGDNAVPPGMQSKYIPNFGAGVYYDTDRFYVGFSVPRILENSIDLSDSDTPLSREVIHYYGILGASFDLGENVVMQPQAILRFTANTPFDGDFNVNFMFVKRFMAGVSYRLGGSRISGIGESLALLGGLDITPNLFFGVTYGYGLSELSDQHSGSLEGVLRVMFGKATEGEEFLNPRFF
jgi:type IX secretion system PorP/SprF family membrane protein